MVTLGPSKIPDLSLCKPTDHRASSPLWSTLKSMDRMIQDQNTWFLLELYLSPLLETLVVGETALTYKHFFGRYSLAI